MVIRTGLGWFPGDNKPLSDIRKQEAAVHLIVRSREKTNRWGLAIANSACMSIQGQVFVWKYVCISLCYKHGSGTDEPYVTLNLTCQGIAKLFMVH